MSRKCVFQEFSKSIFFQLLIVSYAFSTTTDSLFQNTDNHLTETGYLKYDILLVNDNYIAKWLPQERGQYFGADDFLTASLLSHIYYKNWQYSLIFNSITLRHFNLRYDLLSVLYGYSFNYSGIRLSIGSGLIYKGDLGGGNIQNGYHRLRAIQKVDMPYSSDKGLALILPLNVQRQNQNLLATKDILRIALELTLYTGFIPSRIVPKISYQTGFWENKLQMEVLIADRIYLNYVRQYSEMVRPGLCYAIASKIKIWNTSFLNFGFITIPTRHVESDPVYPKYRHKYLPQVWLGISWNSGWSSIIDEINY